MYPLGLRCCCCTPLYAGNSVNLSSLLSLQALAALSSSGAASLRSVATRAHDTAATASQGVWDEQQLLLQPLSQQSAASVVMSELLGAMTQGTAEASTGGCGLGVGENMLRFFSAVCSLDVGKD
jgi:hypothetical protein